MTTDTGPSIDTQPIAQDLPSLLRTIREAFPENPALESALEVCLSASAALLISGLEGCQAILLEGSPASGKTTLLRFFANSLQHIVYRTDNFTPAAFVSHRADESEEGLRDIDLLPRVQHKVFVVPEMRVVFSARREQLTENLGVLTRVLDGHGYLRDTGAHGQRGYSGDYKFCFLGATTPLSKSAWREMSNLGSRMLVFDMGQHVPSAEGLAQMLTDNVPFEDRVDACAESVTRFLADTWERHGGYGRLSWDREEDRSIATSIGSLALLTARLRGDTRLSDDDSDTGIEPENPTRLNIALMNLARGHAIISGRARVNGDDLRIARRVALNTCPIRRRRAYGCLLNTQDTTANTRDIESSVGCSTGTALSLMEELVDLRLAEWSETHTAFGFDARQQPMSIKLATEHAWLAEEE